MKTKLISCLIGAVVSVALFMITGFTETSDKKEYVLLTFTTAIPTQYWKHSGTGREEVNIADKRNAAGEFISQISILEEQGWEIYSFNSNALGSSAIYFTVLMRKE